MQPGEEYNFTVAVVVANTWQALTEHVDLIRRLYNVGIAEQAPDAAEPELELTSSAISTSLFNLRYTLPTASNVTVTVFDAAGRRVSILYQGTAPAGTSELSWNVTAVPAGVYFVRLDAGSENRTARVVVVK
jgi:hypothetical protein